MKIKDIFYYIQGNIRYKLFYSIFVGLIRNHILEQIYYRINSMDIKCFADGQCKMCGCKTIALQMCDKACDKPCYPPMMNKWRWNRAVQTSCEIEGDNIWLVTKDKFKLMPDDLE